MTHSDDEGLQALVLDRVEADLDLPDEAKLVVLAALESAEMVEQALDGACQIDTDRLRDRSGGVVAEPAGAFLTSIRVRGFRGIGPQAALTLHPAPGLTVVAGRNGSGKSSFAEAFELALTGDSYRWSRKRSQTSWKEHWRNIHDGDDCAIRVELAEQDAGTTTIGVDWTGDVDLDARNSWVQRPGQRREPGTDGFGWRTALELFRPMLSYDEVGGLLEAEPSKLYDALAGILGLERITDAQYRLDEAVRTLEQPLKNANALRTELKKTLDDMADERADQALAQLKKQRPDIDTVEQLATGASAAPAGLAQLRGLSNLRLPDEADVVQAVEALRTAATDVVSSSGTSIDLAERRSTLLRQALELHQHHGSMPCPVCGAGTLDEQWQERVQAELTREDDGLADLRAARWRLDSARKQAQQLVTSVGPIAAPGPIALSTLAAAQAAQRDWSRPPADAAALADHLENRCLPLRAAMTALREEAAAQLAALEDAWTPVAGRLGAWVSHARQAETREHTLKIAQSASKWAKANAALLRNERLEPLADEARAIWAALRQESSVELGTITLEGQKNRRHVDLHAEVDGEAAGALGVMSQGELHALTLALFLPRATRPESPFRFLVLDDPIQAMDPAKVDGFVQVLGELAQSRQVIVFSHDDRLAEAVRRTSVPARILELYRAVGSSVEIVDALDPARRYVQDAFAVARDENVPADVQTRVLPGLCRMALEAAARDTFLGRRFTAGADRQEVERQWQEATKLRQRVALALYDDRAASTETWTSAKPWRKAALGIGNAVHAGLRGDPVGSVRNVEDTVDDLLLAGRR